LCESHGLSGFWSGCDVTMTALRAGKMGKNAFSLDDIESASEHRFVTVGGVNETLRSTIDRSRESIYG